MNIRISIADDHPMIIQGLQNMLSRYPHITLVNVYADGELLMKGLTENVPDVLLLDIQLPGKTGDELVPVILKKYPGIRILILTNFDSALYLNNLLRNGVHGYVLKTAEEDIIINAIDMVYNGGLFIEEGMKDKIHRLESRIQKTVSSKSSLTPREKEILQLIVNGDTSPEIAERLFLSLHTVENYRVSILLKLDVKNIATLVKKALKLGLAE